MTKTTITFLGCLGFACVTGCGADTTADPEAASAADGESGHASGQDAEASAGGPSAHPEDSVGDGTSAEQREGSAGSGSGMDARSAAKAGAAQSPQAQSGPAAEPANTGATGDMAATGPIDHHGDIRGLCNLSTQFPDDHACIPAPPEGEGLQIHMGPSDYDDPDELAKFVMHPGDESSECFELSTPNDEVVYYQTSMLSGRAGTHHIINTLFEGGEMAVVPGPCSEDADNTMSIGSAPGASKPFMPRGTVAPEYAHVGRTLPAHAVLHADMHYYNFTDQDILREFWLNIYFVDKEQITEQASQIALLGGFSWNQEPIQPKTDMVYKYECPVTGDGYILSLLGHYHAHGKRFTASIKRATGETEKVFEMFDYMDPAQFEYNSVITNPMFTDGAAGAVSGQLPIHDGDIINWECHIVNDSNVALRYVNEVQTGEMCNLWGASIGADPISCYVR